MNVNLKEVPLHTYGIRHAALVVKREFLGDSVQYFPVRRKAYGFGVLNGAGDVVNRRTLKPLLRDNILRDAIHVF